MYKQIVVAVDDSNTSLLALEEAIKLAAVHQAVLNLVHVVDVSFASEGGMWIGLDEYLVSIRKNANTILQQLEDRVKKAKLNVKTYLIEMTGPRESIAEEILSAVQNIKGDLLAIGTHGRRGFRRLILGSVAEEVIRIATIPILLIRGNDEEEK
jgi:nucleotide-binding universal stress UspA family protein